MGSRSDLFPETSPVEIVLGNVDAAVQTRQAGVVGGVVVARPLHDDVLAGPTLVLEEPVLLGAELAEPTGEIRAAGETGERLGGGAAEGAVTGDEARERRRDEGVPLIRHPLDGAHPARARDLGPGVARLAGPPLHGDLPLVAGQVLMALAGRRGGRRDHLDHAGLERQAGRVVGGAAHVRGLSVPAHPADGRDGPHRIVLALDAPGHDGRIVHGPVHREVHLHVPFEGLDLRTRTADALRDTRIVGDMVGDRVPVSRRRLGPGPVRPELGETSRPVPALDDVRGIGRPGDRVGRVSDAVVGAERVVAPRARRDVEHLTVARVESAAQPDDARMGGLERGVRCPAGDRRWTRVDVDVGRIRPRERERPDVVPLRPDDRLHLVRQRDAVLCYEHVEGEGLPAAGVGQQGRVGELHDERLVGRHVPGRVCVPGGLVGAVRQPVREDGRCNAVADGGRDVPLGRGEARVEAQLEHLRVERGQRDARAGGPGEAGRDDPVGRKADRRFAVGQWRRRARPLGGEVRHRRPVVVRRPRVVHRDRDVEEVPRMHGRPGGVAPDRFEKLLVPLSGDRLRRRGPVRAVGLRHAAREAMAERRQPPGGVDREADVAVRAALDTVDEPTESGLRTLTGERRRDRGSGAAPADPPLDLPARARDDAPRIVAATAAEIAR